MSPLTPSDRLAIMGEVILQIQGAGYIYDLGKGATSWTKIPPPRGTRLNCQAAARLAKEMAEERGVDRLQIVATKIKDGFFIPASPGLKALGSSAPPVQTGQVKGWELDNHYRVKDPVIGKVYDPIFGTSGAYNPDGVRCTSTRVEFPKMTSVYGEKYEITRAGTFTARLLSQRPVAPKYVVKDQDYT
jgi:hypothetical protein